MSPYTLLRARGRGVAGGGAHRRTGAAPTPSCPQVRRPKRCPRPRGPAPWATGRRPPPPPPSPPPVRRPARPLQEGRRRPRSGPGVRRPDPLCPPPPPLRHPPLPRSLPCPRPCPRPPCSPCPRLCPPSPPLPPPRPLPCPPRLQGRLRRRPPPAPPPNAGPTPSPHGRRTHAAPATRPPLGQGTRRRAPTPPAPSPRERTTGSPTQRGHLPNRKTGGGARGTSADSDSPAWGPPQHHAPNCTSDTSGSAASPFKHRDTWQRVQYPASPSLAAAGGTDTSTVLSSTTRAATSCRGHDGKLGVRRRRRRAPFATMPHAHPSWTTRRNGRIRALEGTRPCRRYPARPTHRLVHCPPVCASAANAGCGGTRGRGKSASAHPHNGRCVSGHCPRLALVHVRVCTRGAPLAGASWAATTRGEMRHRRTVNVHVARLHEVDPVGRNLQCGRARLFHGRCGQSQVAGAGVHVASNAAALATPGSERW